MAARQEPIWAIADRVVADRCASHRSRRDWRASNLQTPQDIEWCVRPVPISIVRAGPHHAVSAAAPVPGAPLLYISFSHAQVMTDAMPPAPSPSGGTCSFRTRRDGSSHIMLAAGGRLCSTERSAACAVQQGLRDVLTGGCVSCDGGRCDRTARVPLWHGLEARGAGTSCLSSDRCWRRRCGASWVAHPRERGARAGVRGCDGRARARPSTRRRAQRYRSRAHRTATVHWRVPADCPNRPRHAGPALPAKLLAGRGVDREIDVCAGARWRRRGDGQQLGDVADVARANPRSWLT